MNDRDIHWITEEPGDKALHEGVLAMIDCGLDGPDGVGPSDALKVWQAMARTMRVRLESTGEPVEWTCEAKARREMCQWPTCGCDPHAERIFAALQENGYEIVQVSGAGIERRLKAVEDMVWPLGR